MLNMKNVDTHPRPNPNPVDIVCKINRIDILVRHGVGYSDMDDDYTVYDGIITSHQTQGTGDVN